MSLSIVVIMVMWNTIRKSHIKLLNYKRRKKKVNKLKHLFAFTFLVYVVLVWAEYVNFHLDYVCYFVTLYITIILL